MPDIRRTRISSGVRSLLAILIAAAILLVINLLSARLYAHWSWVEAGPRHLSNRTIEAIRSLRGQIDLYALFERSHPFRYAANTLIHEFEEASTTIPGLSISAHTIDPNQDLPEAAALLRKANLRIDGLEKMIADLNQQLADKKSEVDRLRENLAQMGLRVESLAEEVAQSSARIEDLSSEKVELQNQLHTVYYIVGSEKELRDAQIINKQGFIGRTLTVGATGNLDSFTAADSRLLAEIPVGHKRVTVVSSHPEDSYELAASADKTVEKLRITDPARFWESSKILIISYK